MSDAFAPPADPPLQRGQNVDVRATVGRTLARVKAHAPVLLWWGLAVVACRLGVSVLFSATGDSAAVEAGSTLFDSFVVVGCTSGFLRSVHARETGVSVAPGAALVLASRDAIELWFSVVIYQVLVVCGLLLGVVPGLFLLGRWGLLWPVLVLERRGLGRAASLSEGRWGKLLAVWGLSWCVVVLAAPIACLGDVWLYSAWGSILSLIPPLAMYDIWRSLGGS